MSKTVFYILPWILGSGGIAAATFMSRRLLRKEKWLLLFCILPIIGNWIIPAFLGVGIHDYRYYHWITAGTALPIVVWVLVEFLARLRRKEIRVPRLVFFEKALLCFIPVGIFSQFVGLIVGNSKKYLLSDAYKWLLFPLLYIFILLTFNAERLGRLLEGFYRISLGLVVTSAAFILWTIIQGHILKIHIAGIEILLPLLLVLNFNRATIRSADLNFPIRGRTTLILLITVSVLGIFYSQERTLWLTMVPGLLAAAFLVATRYPVRQLMRIPLRSIISLVLVGLLFFGVTHFPLRFLARATEVAGGRAKTGFEELQSGAPRLLDGRVVVIDKYRLGSLERRVLELVDGWNYMKSAAWRPKYIIGMGDGAQFKVEQGFESSASTGEDATGWNHTFHFTFMGIFFTKGALGLIILLTFLAGLFIFSYQAIKPAQNGRQPERAVVFPAYFITFILAFLYYFVGGSMLYDMTFILYTALIGMYLRARPDSAGRTSTVGQGPISGAET